MSDLIQAQAQYRPRYIPYLNDTDWIQLDRIQSLEPSEDHPSEDLKEVGTAGKLGTIKETPVVGCSATQREYCSIDFYNAIANKSSGNSVTLDDFATTAGDFCGYLNDKNGAVIGTVYYPRQRLVSLGLSIGDPKIIVDRNFTFTGEKAITLQGDNKHLIFKKKTLTAPDIGSADIAVITLDDPVAVEDPDNAAKFMFRVLRVKAGVTTLLVEGSDYTSTANALTVENCAVDDVIKYYYSSGSWVTSPAAPFTTNVVDKFAIRANSCVLYLGTAGRLHKIQSASLAVDLSREDIPEIGSEEIIARSVLENTVTVDLGKLLDTSFSMEEILRGNTSGKLDSSKYIDTLTFMIAVYSDATHSTFKLGYKVTNMSVASSTPASPAVGANVSSGFSLKSDNLLITNQIGDLGI